MKLLPEELLSAVLSEMAGAGGCPCSYCAGVALVDAALVPVGHVPPLCGVIAYLYPDEGQESVDRWL